MWASALDRTRRRFEPRRHAARGRRGVRAPRWLNRSDPLMVVYDGQERLFREGRVAWGRSVVANRALFSPGPHAHPAQFVLGLDGALDAQPELLDAAALACAGLRRGPLPDEPGLRAFAELVRDDRDRSQGTPLPAGLGPIEGLRSVVTVVHREHLPECILAPVPFPLLVDPATWASLVLPWEYWDAAIVARWRDSLEADRSA
jgi:hypothetical protein